MNLVGFDEEQRIEDKVLKVINHAGETVNHINKGDRIVRKSSIDAFKEIKENEAKAICESWDIREFYKANTEELQLISKELSQNEKAFLFSIAPYISFDSNILQVGKGRKAEDLGTEDLIEITGMSRSTLYHTIDLLHKKDIVYKGKNSRNRQFYINPLLYCKGNRINKVLRDMFKNYKIRSRDNVLWKDLNE
jgi:cellobiose-specific phosphotransferase system component IIA